MPSIGDLVYRVGYTQQGVGIVTQSSTTAEQSGLLKGNEQFIVYVGKTAQFYQLAQDGFLLINW